MRQLPQPPARTIWQNIETARCIAQYSALSAMIFLRCEIGYRALHPGALVIIFTSLTFLSSFGDPANRPQDVFYFAVIMLVAGLTQRIVRRRDLGNGHSYYIGTSRLQSLRWPAWMQRDRFIPRFIDPTLCLLSGFALIKLGSRLLGAWLVFAGFCLHWLEHQIYIKQLNQRLDTTDGLIESQIQGEHVEHFSPPAVLNQNQPDQPSVSTGLGSDLAGKIKKRKNKP